jgi:hypothetical protein
LRFFRQFISEIRRREIIPVVITYTVVGWLVLQIAEVTFEPLGMPEGGVRLIIIMSIAGFPAVLFLAWVLDVKSQGVMFDLPLWQVEGAITQQQKKASRPLVLLLCKRSFWDVFPHAIASVKYPSLIFIYRSKYQ